MKRRDRDAGAAGIGGHEGHLEDGHATVRDVHETLREGRPVAYTTVMTTMNILETKGLLEKARADRAFRYTPTRSRQQVVGGMVKDFVNRVFDGAAQPLLLHLATSRSSPRRSAPS